MRKMSEMPYHIGLQVKIYPSDLQKHLIAVNDGAKRAVYNHLVACGNERYRLGKAAGMVPVYRERIDYLDSVSHTVNRVKNALPFLYGKEVDEQAIANAIKITARHGRIRRNSIVACQPLRRKAVSSPTRRTRITTSTAKKELTSNVRFEDSHHITLPKLGRIRFDGSPKLIANLLDRTADTRIGTVTIWRDAVGEYWASFSIASEEPFYGLLPKTGSRQGIDLNLLELVNDSDGGDAPNRRFYQSAQEGLAKAQHRLSRMGEHAKKENRSLASSKNYQKQRKKTAFLHRKVQRQRKDYLHVLSKREVENQDIIAAEDLKVSNMKKNHKLAKAVSDAGWRTFLTMLQYKGALYGKTVVLVPPNYTTQTCSVCGYVMKGEEHLTLKTREWECPNCHTIHHRDTNAAKNILARGIALLKEQGILL